MEWVETTGRTVEDAKDSALDQLGVDELDAEVEVVDEPKTGLFGRVRAPARVRARVRPTPARPRVGGRAGRQRRHRSERVAAEGPSGRDGRVRPGGGGRDGALVGSDEEAERAIGLAPAEQGGVLAAEKTPGNARVPEEAANVAVGDTRPPAVSESGDVRVDVVGDGSSSIVFDRDVRSAADPATTPEGEDVGRPRATRRSASTSQTNGGTMMGQAEVVLGDQAEIGRQFLAGLIERFEVEGSVEVTPVDEETMELAVAGRDIGLLVGPRGETLSALQELTRTVVQRRVGRQHGRLVVDVGGYRRKRRIALETFIRRIADEVRVSGVAQSLEPMAAPDRKTIHDAVNEIVGVTTTSEGEEPGRHVVVRPGGD